MHRAQLQNPVPWNRFFPLLPICILATGVCTAQTFQPFQANSRMVYGDVNGTAVFSLVFDSVAVQEDTTVYHNHRLPGPGSAACGVFCLPLVQPSWMGTSVKVAANGTHVFRSILGATVTIPFHTDPLDTMTIYQDGDQLFKLSYLGSSTMDVLGLSDDVREWQIHHQDLSGTTIPSALDGERIQVGAIAGLIRSIRIDSFPNVPTIVDLMGRADPDLGFHATTQAGLYDFQPGDEVHTRWSHYSATGSGGPNYVRYVKHLYLTRDDLPDSVRYSIRQERFEEGSTILQVDTFDLSLSRSSHDPVSPPSAGLLYSPFLTVPPPMPYERSNGGPNYHVSTTNLCGKRFVAFTMNPHGQGPCASPGCHLFDASGFPVDLYYTATVVPGLGAYAISDVYVGATVGYSDQVNIIYFKKDGEACGTEITVGIPDPRQPPPTLHLYPNPTDGPFGVKGLAGPLTAMVHDMQGKLVMTRRIAAGEPVETTGLEQGTYLVRVVDAGGLSAWGRLVLLR